MLRTPACSVLLASLCFSQSDSAPLLTNDRPRPAWADANGDGLLDVLTVDEHGHAVLLENLGDGNFADITRAVGLANTPAARASLWCDFDVDGRMDLLLVDGVLPLRLYRQSVQGNFVDATAAAGLARLRHFIDANWIDYDADGLPDLQLLGTSGDAIYHNLGGLDFVLVPFGSSGGGAGLPLGGTPGVGPTPTIPVNPQWINCVGSIEDQAGAPCLEASSLPVLGSLYPITNELFVDSATGRVGINTTSPTHQLSVNGMIQTTGGIVFPDASVQTTATLQGPQGAAGNDGPAGPAGSNGSDGADGAAGAQGPAGPTGAAGSNGSDGADGAAGAQGPAGPTGAAGSNGSDGADGAAGAQGPAGSTGP
ncbi:MAG: hypothetical protein ACI835_004843, partial [Planctomycetota bacterium]